MLRASLWKRSEPCFTNTVPRVWRLVFCKEVHIYMLCITVMFLCVFNRPNYNWTFGTGPPRREGSFLWESVAYILCWGEFGQRERKQARQWNRGGLFTVISLLSMWNSCPGKDALWVLGRIRISHTRWPGAKDLYTRVKRRPKNPQ